MSTEQILQMYIWFVFIFVLSIPSHFCKYHCLQISHSSGSRIWSGGPNLLGGPTLKWEGCTPDFIESCAKQCKMYALTLGLGGLGLWAPLDPLLSQIIHGPKPLTYGLEQQHKRSISTLRTSISLAILSFHFGNGSMYFWARHFFRCHLISFCTYENFKWASVKPLYLLVANSIMLAIANKPQS